MPLGDNYFTFLSLVTIELLRTQPGESSRPPISSVRWSLAILLIAVSALFKITGILLLVFAIEAYRQRHDASKSSRRLFFIISALILCFALYFVFSGNASVIKSYALLWKDQFAGSRSKGIFIWSLNFIFISLPTQIIPHLNYLFPGHESLGIIAVSAAHPYRSLFFMGMGISITAVIFYGIAKGWQQFRPEILYFIFGLPIYLPITNSTLRYLSYSQIFIVVFFIIGLKSLFREFGTTLVYRPRIRHTLAAAIVSIFFLSIFARLAGSARDNRVSIRNYITSIQQTAIAYRELDRFLSSMPSRSTRIIMVDPGNSRWKAIRGFEYYAPDKNLSRVVDRYDTILVLDTVTRLYPTFSLVKSEAERKIESAGIFNLEECFVRDNAFVHIHVYRLRNRAQLNHIEESTSPTQL